MNINFTLVIQTISFLILLGLLAKFLYRPFMNYLDERSKEIKDLIEETQRNRETAQREFMKAEDQLRKTKEQVLKMKSTAIREADENKRFTMEEAKKEAHSLLGRAKLEIKQELDSAKNLLKTEVASLSIEIAKKILDREVKEKDHKKLILDSLKELNKTNNVV